MGTTSVFVMKLPATIARRDRILKLIDKTPMSAPEIAQAIHAHPRTVNTYLAFLLDKRHGRCARIAKWRIDPKRGNRAPLYQAGAEPDAKPPRALTKQETNRRYRRNLPERNPELYDRLVAQKKASRIQPRHDPMVSAMFGASP